MNHVMSVVLFDYEVSSLGVLLSIQPYLGFPFFHPPPIYLNAISVVRKAVRLSKLHHLALSDSCCSNAAFVYLLGVMTDSISFFDVVEGIRK